ncbi:MAG: TlpA disulfide reductase family protein [Anaerolineales bacterium]
MPTNLKQRSQNQKYKILAMALVGGGLLIVGIAALILLPNPGASASPAKVELNAPARVSYPAPDIQLNDIKGNPVSLADYQGQVVLVNNWATWCPPCREEMPILNGYFRDHQHQDFVLVAIDAGDPADMVSDFVARYGMDFPIWIDPSSSALNSFRNNYLPSSYLIDRQGQVVMVWSGAVTRASLEQNITPLLKE